MTIPAGLRGADTVNYFSIAAPAYSAVTITTGTDPILYQANHAIPLGGTVFGAMMGTDQGWAKMLMVRLTIAVDNTYVDDWSGNYIQIDTNSALRQLNSTLHDGDYGIASAGPVALANGTITGVPFFGFVDEQGILRDLTGSFLLAKIVSGDQFHISWSVLAEAD